MTQVEAEGTQRDGQRQNVLVVGASFAGLATAWWMQRLGYAVTIVEIATGLRKGGTPVDIREGVIAVVRQMGLLERIAAASLPPRPMNFLDERGVPLARMGAEPGGELEGEGEKEYEIERDDLLDILFGEIDGKVEMLFGESVAALEQTGEEVLVTLASGAQRPFAFVFGCDGTHSAVRRMCFGEESRYSHFLEHYFALSIVDQLLIPENTSQMFNVPGKTVMLNAYHGKTDIAFSFFSEQEIPYGRRDTEQQKRMVEQEFAGVGWRSAELLEELKRCENFYFDKLCQIRMGSWVQGRVVLVGDAGYCPSPAAGMGGSMALLGAAALGEALEAHPGDVRQALEAYQRNLRPEVEQIQQGAVEFGLPMFAPRTEEEIRQRNERFHLRER